MRRGSLGTPRGNGHRPRSRACGRSVSISRAWWVPLALLPLVLAAPIAGLDSVSPESAHAANFHKCKNVKKAGKYKLKKIKVTRPVKCGDARTVAKKWVQRKFDQNNAIARSGRNWFCTWHRRDPQSVDTGTADCEAGATDEIRYLVRRR